MSSFKGWLPFFKSRDSKAGPKILFISTGAAPDYQCDMIFHGLKKLYGRNVMSSSPMWYMFNDISQETKAGLYGCGFTIYGNLDVSLKNTLDAKEIRKKIERKHFDKVVYGSIHRDQSFLEEVVSSYGPSDIAFVDGEDVTSILEQFKALGRYFKRELLDTETGVYPIQFCIPAEKIAPSFPEKKKPWATVVPGKLETYIFLEEKKYYRDYQESVYAHTQKKAGWDCLRHYEILANWCIPWFAQLDECPKNTLFRLPREAVLAANREEYGERQARECVLYLVDQLKKNMTTEAMARYLMEPPMSQKKF
jgi:hypothetical protein